MNIERRHPGRLDGAPLDVAVVIDVLRATSTAAVLLGRGAPRVRVAATPADVAALPPRARYLIVSELDEAAAFGERIDNSPVRALGVDLEGIVPVLVTTNGTRALCAAAASAGIVLVASFLNLSAAAARVRALAPPRVTLLPCGELARLETRIEDELCADALAALLSSEVTDLAAIMARIRDDENIQRRLRSEPGFQADLDLCLTPDLYSIAPEFSSDGPTSGWLTGAQSVR